MFRTKLIRAISPVLIAFCLAGCGVVGGIAPPKPHVEWVIGIDVTSSVNPKEFAAYPEIVLEAVISRLRSGDRVHVLLVDSDPRKQAKDFELDGGKTGLAAKAAEIYDYINSIKRPSRYRGTTNLGGFLSYCKELVSKVRAQEEALREKGYSIPRGSDYVAVVLTDGKPDGRQTAFDDGDWPKECSLWGIGIAEEDQPSFKKLCIDKLNIPEGNIQLIPFGMWKPGLKNFAVELGRQKNGALLDRIGSRKKMSLGL
jgi:hypothetical protein